MEPNPKNLQINFFTHLSNYPFLSKFHSNISYILDKLPGGLGNNLNNFNYYKGSFRAAIVLAIYMGFERIYLVGFDYTHSPARNKHWYEKGKGIITRQDGYQKEFIQTAREYADIITVTLDGKSKHLKYITYKDLTGIDPVYRENNQLVRSNKYLNALSNYANAYKVY
ncbi:hypothetical protein ACFL7M_18145 [Thermodesulfobacteriota bacterium]